MNIKKRLSYILLILCSQVLMYGQCPTYVAGYSCEDAPVICDLTCLNGFVGQMEDTSRAIIKLNKTKQPDPICNTGGRPQNMSWFAFIAGSVSASITISPSNCQFNRGIQAGMFGDCNFADNISGNGPNDEEFLDCDITSGGLSIVTLQSNKLKVGQTYYFYVDGNDADVCSYRVTINSATQAPPLPKMQSYDQSNDTLIACVSDEINLANTALGLEIEYHWSVDTFNITTKKKFERTFLSGRKYQFDRVGRYTISMYATNGCSITDTISKVIVIKDPKEERFPEINVCQDKLPIPGPKNLDPNNDGIVGWIGSNLIEGENIFRIGYSPTCYIDQKIKVNALPAIAPIKILLSGCDSVVFRDEVFVGDLADWPVVGKSSDPYGCDTLYEVSTTVFRMEGRITPSSCQNGKVEIKFVESSSSLLPTTVVKYRWTDSNNKVLQTSVNEKTVLIDFKTRVNLIIWIINGQDSCRSIIMPIDVDPLSTKPAKPTPIDWDDTYCENEGAKQYILAPLVDSIRWSISSGTIVSNKNVATVTLTSANSQAILCAETRNTCGVESFCDTIKFIKKTQPKLLPQYKICQDSSLNLKPLDSGQNPRWTSSKGVIQYLQEGNIRINYNTSGTDTLSIIDTFSGCSYFDTAYVRVVEQIISPNPTYVATAQSLAIKWPAIPCTKFYRISLDDKVIDTTSKTNFLITQLITNQDYQVKVEAISDPITNCNCSTSSTTIVARTGNCNFLTFEVKVPVNSVCEDGWKQRMQLLHSKEGNKEDNKVKWSGLGVDPAGFFIPENAGVGLAKIIGRYEEQGCIYIDTAFIDVFTNPILMIEIEHPACIDDKTGKAIIHTKDGRFLKHMYLGAEEIQDSIIDDLKPGIYDISIYDKNLCVAKSKVQILPPPIPNLNLNLIDTVLFSGSSLILQPKSNVKIDSINWIINDNISCNRCPSFTFNAIEKGLFDIDINYQYGRCIGTETISIEVIPVTKLFLPNILKVSNSGAENSILKIGSSVPNMKILNFSLFSRWGEVLIKQDNITLSEDAMHSIDFSESKLHNGVYIINITFIDPISGLTKTEVRDITIIR